jgi:hypothetical protein
MSTSAVKKILALVLSQYAKIGLEDHLSHYAYGGEERFMHIGSRENDISHTVESIARSLLSDGVVDSSGTPTGELAEAMFTYLREICFQFLTLVVEKRSLKKFVSKEIIMNEAAEELEGIILDILE